MAFEPYLLGCALRLHSAVDYTSRVARDACLDKESAEVDPQSAHQTDIRIVKLYLDQVGRTALLGVSYADKCSAQKMHGADINSYHQREFDSIGVEPDPQLLNRSHISHLVAREAILKFGLQVEMACDVEASHNGTLQSGLSVIADDISLAERHLWQ